jgi:regulator of RNase E activity RraB
MRMAGSRDKSGRVLDWWLYDGNREWRIGQLSPGQEQLSIAAIWNDTLLVDRILSGWAPGVARDIGGSAPTAAARRADNPDTAAIQELEKAGSRTDAVHEIRHYLYFPKEDSAKTAAQHLAKLGLEATIKRRDDQWAVIGRHKMIPSTDNIESFRNKLEKLAEASGGEYDGWEAAVTRPTD